MKIRTTKGQAVDRKFVNNWQQMMLRLESEEVDLGQLMELWTAELGLAPEDARPGGAMDDRETVEVVTAQCRALRRYPAPTPEARDLLHEVADMQTEFIAQFPAGARWSDVGHA